LSADEVNDEESSWRQAEACLRRLQGSIKRRELDDLRARIKSAEREGRVTEAMQWMAELHRLETAQRTAGDE